MPTRSNDRLPNSDTVPEDNYYKLNTDILLLLERLRIVKNKRNNTSWYSIWTRIKLWKEIWSIQKETEKVGERLIRLDAESKNPIQIVKRV